VRSHGDAKAAEHLDSEHRRYGHAKTILRSPGSSKRGRSGEQEQTPALLERLRQLRLAEARGPKLAERLVAREQHEELEGASFARAWPQPLRGSEVAREPAELVAPIRALAVDEAAGRGIDRLDAVERREDGVLRGPEADGERDRLRERRGRVR